MNRIVAYLFFFFITVIFITEVTLRELGFALYKYPTQNLKVIPFFYEGYDSLLGFKLREGNFKMTLNDTFSCVYSINNSLNRITSINEPDFNDKIIIMGCSFTFGDLLNDNQTHPFKLQSYLLPSSIKVINMGASGYGPTQFFLQLNNLKNSNKAIKALIINYASFQDGRTNLARSWRCWLAPAVSKYSSKNEIKLPFFNLQNDSLILSYKQLSYNLIPFQHKSIIVQLVDNIIKINEDKQANIITKKVFIRIVELCKNKNILLIVAAMSNDPLTIEMINYLKANGVETINYNIDLNKPEYNFQPIDWHPNEKANTIFADSIYNKLKELHIVQ